MLINNDVLEKDLVRCSRKRIYPGLGIEFKRILKLLNEDNQLPGESPMRGFDGDSSNRIWHAYINLPHLNLSKREGARIVYYRYNLTAEIKVLYVGGHRDTVYNNERFLTELIKSRSTILDGGFISYEGYLQREPQ